MKKEFFLTIIFFVFIGCAKKEKDFDSFEYSYAGTFSTVFSIKFSASDTIFLREHWNRGGNEDYQFPKAEKNYFAILNLQQRNELSSLIKKVDFKELKSEYEQNYEDGSAFNIIFKKDNFKKEIYVHSFQNPEELHSLSKWIYNLKMELKLTETKKELIFESLEAFRPPPPPPSL